MSKLHVDSVIKAFGSRQVLTDIYLSCNTGEIVGLLGRNGSGKSTLLKIIFGSLCADTKFVKIDGKIIHTLYDNRNLVRYLPQHHFLPGSVKISKFISLFCGKQNATIIRENLLIKPLLDKTSRELSGGERRILEIMLIIYSEAQYILIDEPFNGVAPVFKDDIKRMIREQSRNKGFIITDHDYRNILDIATRTILLYDGGTREINGKDELEYWGYLPETN